MRAKALAVDAPRGRSTLAAPVATPRAALTSRPRAPWSSPAAEAVAKHGNRRSPRESGSADVLTALGVNIEADLRIVRQCLWEIASAF